MTESPPTSSRGPILALAFCCVFWGYSFPVNQIGIHALGETLPPASALRNEFAAATTFLGWRFLVGGILFALFFFKPLFRDRPFAWRGGLIVGAIFSCGMIVQMIGLSFTRPSISGFLTALVVVFTPLAQAFLLKRRVSSATWGAVALALLGAWIMTQQSPDGAAGHAQLVRTPPFPYFGELLTIIGAMLFSGQMLTLDYFGKRDDARQITLLMFLVTALAGIGVGAYMNLDFYAHGHALTAAKLPTLHWTLLSVVVLSTLLAMYMMNVFQPRIAPATASVVYCLEPVFALIFSVLFSAEKLTVSTGLGGLAILAAVFLAARQDDSAPAPNPA